MRSLIYAILNCADLSDIGCVLARSSTFMKYGRHGGGSLLTYFTACKHKSHGLLPFCLATWLMVAYYNVVAPV